LRLGCWLAADRPLPPGRPQDRAYVIRGRCRAARASPVVGPPSRWGRPDEPNRPGRPTPPGRRRHRRQRRRDSGSSAGRGRPGLEAAVSVEKCPDWFVAVLVHGYAVPENTRVSRRLVPGTAPGSSSRNEPPDRQERDMPWLLPCSWPTTTPTSFASRLLLARLRMAVAGALDCFRSAAPRHTALLRRLRVERRARRKRPSVMAGAEVGGPSRCCVWAC
jgi:hypothetical protein